MIYTQIMDPLLGWYHQVESLLLKLVLLPFVLVIWLIGNVLAVPLFLLSWAIKKTFKI